MGLKVAAGPVLLMGTKRRNIQLLLNVAGLSQAPLTCMREFSQIPEVLCVQHYRLKLRERPSLLGTASNEPYAMQEICDCCLP